MTEVVICLKEGDGVTPSSSSDIKSLKIQFDEKMNLSARNNALISYLPKLQECVNLERLTIGSPVSDYVLEKLLNNDRVLRLKTLSLAHRKEHELFVNEELDVHLSNYLNRNPNLIHLLVDDVYSHLTTKNYPKLHKALLNHNGILEFTVGGSGFFSNNQQLFQDPLVINKLMVNANNIPLTLEQKKARFLREYINQMPMTEHYISEGEVLKYEFSRVNYELARLMYLKWLSSDEGVATDDQKGCIDLLVTYYTLVRNIIDMPEQMSKLGKRLNRFQSITDCFVSPFSKDFEKIKNDEASIAQWSQLLRVENEKLVNEYNTKINPISFPDSYVQITSGKNQALDAAKALLADYTKSNSGFMRFCYGHWNRHHVADVNTIVNRINSNGTERIDSMEELIINLKGIKLENPRGSLAARIRFIETNYGSNVAQEDLAPKNSR